MSVDIELSDVPAPGAKDDLKTLPMSEVQKRLSASDDGLTQAEAEKRLAHYGRTNWRRRRPIRSSSCSPISGAPFRG